MATYDDSAVSGIGIVGSPGVAQQIVATPLTAPLGVPSVLPALIVGDRTLAITGSPSGGVQTLAPVFSFLNSTTVLIPTAAPQGPGIAAQSPPFAGVQVAVILPTIDVYHNAPPSLQGPGVPAPSQSPQGISQTFIPPTQTLER